MASTKDEITAIAVEHGYTGRKPDSIAKAIDALADTLAGEDVTGSRSISGAIHALAPYIGAGGGGFEPKGMSEITIDEDILGTGDIDFMAGTNEPSMDVFDANVCEVIKATFISLCGGLNVVATVPLASGIDADSVGVFHDASEVPSTKKVFTPSSGDRTLSIAFKTPVLDDGTAYLRLGLPEEQPPLG